MIFGGSAALLSRGVFGVEADFGYAPRFFEHDNRAGNITGSNVSTLSGSVIVAVPLARHPGVAAPVRRRRHSD